mmetsp:Transcript_117391/g.339382  ORF Transcript_117391/g.339382 Transcript_117391/m.339382 type:complete len:476 (+) Transcript_117391:80-1507(+)
MWRRLGSSLEASHTGLVHKPNSTTTTTARRHRAWHRRQELGQYGPHEFPRHALREVAGSFGFARIHGSARQLDGARPEQQRRVGVRGGRAGRGRFGTVRLAASPDGLHSSQPLAQLPPQYLPEAVAVLGGQVLRPVPGHDVDDTARPCDRGKGLPPRQWQPREGAEDAALSQRLADEMGLRLAMRARWVRQWPEPHEPTPERVRLRALPHQHRAGPHEKHGRLRVQTLGDEMSARLVHLLPKEQHGVLLQLREGRAPRPLRSARHVRIEEAELFVHLVRQGSELLPGHPEQRAILDAARCHRMRPILAQRPWVVGDGALGELTEQRAKVALAGVRGEALEAPKALGMALALPCAEQRRPRPPVHPRVTVDAVKAEPAGDEEEADPRGVVLPMQDGPPPALHELRSLGQCRDHPRLQTLYAGEAWGSTHGPLHLLQTHSLPAPLRGLRRHRDAGLQQRAAGGLGARLSDDCRPPPR